MTKRAEKPQDAPLSQSERFFFEHAGYSYNPATETEEQGHTRCAKELARAEQEATARGWHLDVTASGEFYAWQGEGERACFDLIAPNSTQAERAGDIYTGYDCVLYDTEGKALASLGAVTFKDDNSHEPYRRVVFAELASEALNEPHIAQSSTQIMGVQ